MLGELHQFYLLANVLGVGDRKLNICCMLKSINLALLLRYISYLMIISTTGSIFIIKQDFKVIYGLYSHHLITTSLQLIPGLEPFN